MTLLWLLISWAMAHGPHDCPPLRMLEGPAAQGVDHPQLRACLQEEREHPAEERKRKWLVWSWEVARMGLSMEREAQARKMLANEPDPDRLIRLANSLEQRSPGLARRAARNALDKSQAWRDPVLRAQQLDQTLGLLARTGNGDEALAHARALAALGVLGRPRQQARARCRVVASEPDTCEQPELPDLASPGEPSAEELVPCRDVSRLWMAALWKTPYASERGCTSRLAAHLPEGTARDTAAHLALLLAFAHRDEQAVPVVARYVASTLPRSPVVAERLAEQHASWDDSHGARWWRTWGGLDAHSD